jgi:hypothetical protein
MEEEEVTADMPARLGELREHVRSLEGSRPTDDPELLDLRADLAQLEIDDGDPARAVAQLEILVDACVTLEGPDSESALDFRGLLGRALAEARLYSEAESVLRQVALERNDRLGPDDPQTFVARGNLLRSIGRGGRPEEALVMAERLLADRERVLGPEHRETLQTRGHIAQLHALAGRAETAIVLHEALLDDRERVLGAEDSDVLTSWFNLVATAAESGHVGTEQLWGYVDAMRERLGDDHPATLTSRGILAESKIADGLFEEGLELLEALLADRVRVLGELHPAVLGTHRMIASALVSNGDAPRAVPHAEVVARTLSATLGRRSIDTLQARLARLDVLVAIGADERAEAELASLLEDAEPVLEPWHPLMLQIHERGLNGARGTR